MLRCVTLYSSFAIFAFLIDVSTGANYYRAAVFEYAIFKDNSLSPPEIVQKNLRSYEFAMNLSKSEGADIIVFPEKGLYNNNNKNRQRYLTIAEDIPNPKVALTNPCKQSSSFQNRPILQKLSCLARSHSMFLVAQMLDVKTCEEAKMCNTKKNVTCPKDGKFIFNTNVAFNRKGALVARYYKRHPFFEIYKNNPVCTEDVYFQTDFGRFTTSNGFDLLFYESVKSVQKPGVTNVAYTTLWYDFLPFFFAVPYQQAWAMTNRVNFLGANAQNPSAGTLGSGIFSANKGVFTYTENPDGKSKLLLSNVPKSRRIPYSFKADTKRFLFVNGTPVAQNGVEPRSFKAVCQTDALEKNAKNMEAYKCQHFNVSGFKFIKLKRTEGKYKLCSNNFCCSLSYKANSMDESYYFGVNGDHLELGNKYIFSIQACMLSRCESLNGQPCGNFLLKSNTIFQKVKIRGDFTTKYIYPYAVDSEIRLTDKRSWKFDRKSYIKYRNENENSLLFFGLLGRVYAKDKTLN